MLLAIFGLLVAFLFVFKLAFDGGERYPDVSTTPIFPAERVSAPIQLPFPPGMVAASPDGRLFFIYHMLHKARAVYG